MDNNRQIKVLVVEDTTVVRMLLVHILNSDPQIQVMGTAKNGVEALEFLSTHSPDVILMDLHMPEMDGFETTRKIMESRPIPIVICSGTNNPKETITTFRALEVGAVAMVAKPVGTKNESFESVAAHLLQTIKLMSEVKVVRRWPKPETSPSSTPSIPPARQARSQVRLVGIGASTGGPPVLQTILASLPKDFSVPILIVQHIAPGFIEGLANWLNQSTGVKIHIAAHGMQPMPGNVYLAPDDCHMTAGTGGTIILNHDKAENGLRPSVGSLFRSLAETCGPNAVGVLLTGMGKDGAPELKQMKDRGAVTIAQDRETSVVHGMPGEAIAIGAATYVLPADRIGPAIASQINYRPAPP